MTYRTGNHWGVTIVRQGERTPEGHIVGTDELVAVVVNGDQALAERICTLLNGAEGETSTQASARPWECKITRRHNPATDPCDCRVYQFCAMGHSLDNPPTDSCTCTIVGPHLECPVHHGRRARGPKPPPVGPGCVCDGAGRTCPRHGAVI